MVAPRPLQRRTGTPLAAVAVAVQLTVPLKRARTATLEDPDPGVTWAALAAPPKILGSPVRAAAARMAGSRFITGLPGQSVKEVARWPRTTGTATRRPAGWRTLAPPRLVRVVRPRGSTWLRSSFQASSRCTAATMAAGGRPEEKVPSRATPVVSVLKPPAWAPSTARVTPP
jgi:hypothetical protein